MDGSTISTTRDEDSNDNTLTIDELLDFGCQSVSEVRVRVCGTGKLTNSGRYVVSTYALGLNEEFSHAHKHTHAYQRDYFWVLRQNSSHLGFLEHCSFHPSSFHTPTTPTDATPTVTATVTATPTATSTPTATATSILYQYPA